MEKQKKEIPEREKWLEERQSEKPGERQADLYPKPVQGEATIPILGGYATEPPAAPPQFEEAEGNTDPSLSQATQNEPFNATAVSYLDGTEKEMAPAAQTFREEKPLAPAPEPKRKKNPVLILLVAVIAVLILGIGALGVLIISKLNASTANQTQITNQTPTTNTPAVAAETPEVLPTFEPVFGTPTNSETPDSKIVTTPVPAVENPANPTPTAKVTPVPTKTKVVTPTPNLPKTPATPVPSRMCTTREEKSGALQIIPCSQCKFKTNCAKIP